MLCLRGSALLSQILEPGRRRSAGCRRPGRTAPGAPQNRSEEQRRRRAGTCYLSSSEPQAAHLSVTKGSGAAKGGRGVACSAPAYVRTVFVWLGKAFLRGVVPGGRERSSRPKRPGLMGVAGKGGGGKDRDKAEPWVSIKRSLYGSWAF